MSPEILATIIAFGVGYISRGIVTGIKAERAADQQFGSLRIAAKQLEDRRAKGPC